MKIAVASGKGGTGKTMISTSLAAALVPFHEIQFLDCDVEAPNAHLFLKPSILKTKPAVIPIPMIDKERCTLCSKCVDICEFNALAMLGERILIFDQLCHGCGSCTIHCPVQAISESPRKIGELHTGIFTNNNPFLFGQLTISEPMPTPVIQQLKELMKKDVEITILDSPPGASCSVVTTLIDADYVILVTEPTPFGLHDLRQMVGVLSQTGAPAGVIINREGIGNNCVEDYLKNTQYPILMKIPYQKNIAEGLASGRLLIDIIPEFKKTFLDLYEKIRTGLESKAVA